MIILGINAYHADSSAAIFVDGKLIAATEEERFTRVKHWAGFPERAIQFCLKEAGIGFEDVDHWAIGRDPKAKFMKKIMYLLKHPGLSFGAVKDRLRNSKKVSSIDKELSRLSALPADIFTNKIHQVEHHRSHIASAFFASGFEKAACLSIDGSGDFTTTMTAIGEGNDITVLDSIDFPHSMGIFYTAFTQLLGFPYYGDEYKVMGMAPYGDPRHVKQLEDVVELNDNGLFKLDLSYFKTVSQNIIRYESGVGSLESGVWSRESGVGIPIVSSLFSDKMIREFGEPRKKEDPLTQYHKDMAASVQRFTETVIFHLLNKLYEKTKVDTVCIAGGVAQNSVANGKILRNTAFKKLYIPSAGHDAGISMGAALYTQHASLKYKRQPAIMSAYTGSKFDPDQVTEMLKMKDIEFTQYTNETELLDVVTECLIAGGVVGWFQGRAEFGPRALGARSIIADPRRNDAKEILNSKIKRRESFRPFAPSILKEYAEEFFECNPENCREVPDVVPFMEKVYPIRKEKQALIPAVTHVDGTGRLQTVDVEISPRYYNLIEAFRKKTGIPILLNTSFNENEPIVNSPEEALACYLRTEMDMLVMENVIIERKSNNGK
jgi:carbamoyltransferase